MKIVPRLGRRVGARFDITEERRININLSCLSPVFFRNPSHNYYSTCQRDTIDVSFQQTRYVGSELCMKKSINIITKTSAQSGSFFLLDVGLPGS